MPRTEPLSSLPVLVLDAQATAAHSARGALLDIGWARWSASEGRDLLASEVTARVVASPPGAEVPRAVARLTGLRTAEWARGTAPALALKGLVEAAARTAPPPGPASAVVHFARFEEPFLRALHDRHGQGPFPLDLLCTHAIACRLFPELPRRTLRALAGYFGAGVTPLRRSVDHVAATAFVWRHLVASLGEREGIVDLAELREWLARPARRASRRWPLPRERRLQLPDRPGVYRLLRTGGAVLYVGKAASLRQRVGSHFHSRAERAMDMLTQARDVSCSETETALEAALLESDEIKRLAPPFNIALSAAGREVWFATADLREVRPGPGPDHPTGPLVSRPPSRRSRPCAPSSPPASQAPLALRARAVGVEPAHARGRNRSPTGLHASIGSTGRWRARAGSSGSARACGPVGVPLRWSAARTARSPRSLPRPRGRPGTPSEWRTPSRRRSSARRTRCAGRAGCAGSASPPWRGRSRGQRGCGCWRSRAARWPRARTSSPARRCPFLQGTRARSPTGARPSTSPPSTACAS